MNANHPFPTLAAAALVASVLLAGCEQRTTTTQTPTGSVTTTTVAPSSGVARGVARAGDAVADAALTAKVKAALLGDAQVKALKIDVDTRDGVVTLNGSADSSVGASRAETLARSVDGVKAVENRLAVAPAASAPRTGASATAADVAASAGALTSAAAAAASRVGDRAARAAERAGDVIGDAAITAKVKTAFLADSEIKGLQIDVDTTDGAVTLTGSLETRSSVERAAAIARKIVGVKAVNNRLTVKAGG